MKLLVIIFILIGKCFGNYQYFHFDPKKIKISNDHFNRWIMPQVRKIIKDYDQLLIELNPLNSKLIPIRKSISFLIRKTDNPSEFSIINLSSAFKELQRIDGLLLQNIKSLDQAKFLDHVSRINYSNYLKIQNMIIADSVDSVVVKQINENLQSIKTSIELKSSEIVSDNYKEEFYASWNYFITPLINLNLNRDRKYLIHRLGELNITWNAFNHALFNNEVFLKKNRKYLNTIQNRWNSILKIVLQ